MKFLILFCALLFNSIHGHQVKVWPMPSTMHVHDEHMRIDSKQFTIQDKSTLPCDLIKAAIARYTDRMFTKDCTKLNPKIGIKPIEGTDETTQPVGELKSLLINNNGKCEHYPSMKMVESYQIIVNKDGAELIGDSVWGVLRGLETFSQIVEYVGDSNYRVPIVSITDSPRFAHRGLLIDSSRHFLSMQSIYDTIDALEMNKMNVLHWHIVDDQSFPFVSDKFPQLSQKGAFNPKTHVYTKHDVDAVIEYARQRGIRVLSEFDTPGHVRSWGNSVENLLTTCYDTKEHPNGKVGPINPTLPSTYEFIKDFFTEVAQRFPDQYLHLGGDEVPFECWKSNAQIKKFMEQRKMTKFEELESYYIQKLLDIVGGMNRSYIVWQEVFDNGVKLAPDTVVHVWKGHHAEWEEEMRKVVTDENFHALLSSPWYLNYINYGSDWEGYYMTEPLSFNATEKQKQLVLGGEACMWGEFVDSSNLIARTWPRAAAVAERLWSPASVNKLPDARVRLFAQQCRMQKLGLRVEPIVGPSHCSCDYAL